VTVARWLAVAGGVVTLLTACSADPGVATQSAERLVTPPPTTEAPPTLPPTPADPTAPPTTAAPDAPPSTDTPSTPPPSTGAPTTQQVPTTPAGTLGDRLDVGDAKPPREYDEFVRLALNDIEAWWADTFPAVYGESFEPLRGGVIAAYPERTTPIPGCETDEPTTYEEIAQYAAFYCMDGDFMAYDDGESGVLAQLAAEFGPSILGVVFAHEYGHAIQARAGVLARDLPTIVSEQQADCFAGAWVAHVRDGGAAGITFTDEDVRSGLVAMITVRDPVGVDQFDAGGHGSAFDRVGAFQAGFTDGAARCAELADDPLPLVPNVLRPDRVASGGNSSFEKIMQLVPDDLDAYWAGAVTAAGASMPTLSVVLVASAGAECADPAGSMVTGAVYCPATQQVLVDEALARDLYGRFGDFVVGYMIGGAWSEAAQLALGSRLEGEPRFLADDCLTGAWAGTMIPENKQPDDPRPAAIDAGDLDEAIQTALVVGDESASDDVLGSGFEKIASFREGVLDGLDACLARIGD
jgi:predicted metalloprotease